MILRMEQEQNNKIFFSAFNELYSIETLNKLYPLDKDFSELCTKHEVDLFNDFFIKDMFIISLFIVCLLYTYSFFINIFIFLKHFKYINILYV